MIPGIGNTPPINPIQRVQNSESTTSSKVFEALEYCCYGDTLGTGIEMWSRKRIIENWDRLNKEIVFERTPPYDVGLQKGWYSDDTEMSLGVVKALKAERQISPDLVAQCFLDVYDAFKNENDGIPRGGYGGFRSIASMEDVDRLKELQSFRREGKFRNGLPGNGSSMRVLPVLLYAKEHYPQDTETLLNNIIAQAISTHNHACAVLADFVYIDVANALINGTISFDQTLEFANDFLMGTRKHSHLLPSLDKCYKAMEELSQKFEIPIFGDWGEFTTAFKKQFDIIDKLDAPADEIGTNLDGVLDQILIERPRALKGEFGLSGLANYTLYATLYCWKWTLVDFDRPKDDLKESYFSLMKRCISFGGDVDTLLAHVVPVSFLRLKDEKGGFDLPDWLLHGCIEKDKLKERL